MRELSACRGVMLAIGLVVIPTLAHAAATGTLRVETTPPKATVYINGRAVGYSPFEARVRAGTVKVEARARGMDSARDEVTIAAGEQTVVRLTLLATPVPATFDCNVKATVIMDGVASGMTGRKMMVRPGVRPVAVIAKGYVDYCDPRMRLTAGKNRRYRISLKKGMSFRQSALSLKADAWYNRAKDVWKLNDDHLLFTNAKRHSNNPNILTRACLDVGATYATEVWFTGYNIRTVKLSFNVHVSPVMHEGRGGFQLDKKHFDGVWHVARQEVTARQTRFTIDGAEVETGDAVEAGSHELGIMGFFDDKHKPARAEFRNLVFKTFESPTAMAQALGTKPLK